MKRYYTFLFIMLLQSCGGGVQTDPKVILPVLREAQRCCDGHCEGIYSTIPETAACGDVFRLSQCLSGNKDECPMKGHGEF